MSLADELLADLEEGGIQGLSNLEELNENNLQKNGFNDDDDDDDMDIDFDKPKIDPKSVKAVARLVFFSKF